MGNLNNALVESVHKLKKMGKHGDAGGLFLRVGRTSSRWQLKFRFGGLEQSLSFGTFPEVKLVEARRRATEARAQLAKGVNPAAEKRIAKLGQRFSEGSTFEGLAREWLRVKGREWVPSTARRTLRRLETYVFPAIGKTAVNAIGKPEMVAVLRKVEATGKLETARRIAEACSQIFRFGIHEGRLVQDPCWRIQEILMKPETHRMAALLDSESLGEFLRASYDYVGRGIVVRTALRLLPMLLLRPGELRLGEWCEVDFDREVWAIPPARRKLRKDLKETGEPHIVPLSRQAVAMLRALHAETGTGKLIFPGQRFGRPISDGTLNMALRALGYSTSEDVTAHGFRATARTLGEEILMERPQVIEAQLAHAVTDALGTSYNRTEFHAARKDFMQNWSDLLDQLRNRVPNRGGVRRHQTNAARLGAAVGVAVTV